CLLYFLAESQQIVRGEGNKAAGNLDDVEAQFLALADVAMYCVGPLAQHELDETARRNQYVVDMADVNQFANGLPRHEREGAASELERVHIGAHRFQHILEVTFAHRRVIRAADLSHAAQARFSRPRVGPQKIEGPVIGPSGRFTHEGSFYVGFVALCNTANGIPGRRGCASWPKRCCSEQKKARPSTSLTCVIES